MKKNIIVIVIICILLSFLLFQRWIWNYLDTFWLSDINNIWNILRDTFSIWSTNTLFWFDNWLTVFFRTIVSLYSFIVIYLFWLDFGQFIFYFVYFLLIYIFSYKIYNKLYTSEVAFFWAILTTFNPMTIWLMNTSTAMYAFPWFLILLNSFYNLYTGKKLRIIDILWVFVWFSLMFTYWRLFIIFLILFFSLSLLFVFNKKPNIKSLIITWLIQIILFSPFLFLFIHQKIIDSKYSHGLFNYFESNKDYVSVFSSWLHNNYIWFEKLIFKFHSSNLFQTNSIFVNWIFLFIIFSFIFLFILLVRNKKNVRHTVLLILFIIFFGTQFIYLLPTNIFQFLSYDLMFLAWNLYWWKFLIFFVFCFIVLEVLIFYKNNNKVSKILKILICVFVLFSIIPALNFVNNFKTQKIDYTKLNPGYNYWMWKNQEDMQWTLFFPENEALFQWSPYPIKYNYISNIPVVSDNKRSVDNEQIFLKEEGFNLDTLTNKTALLNLKNIIIYKDLKTNDYWVEWYSDDNLQLKWEKYINILKNHKDFQLVTENIFFAHFSIVNWWAYEYFLYVPSQVIQYDIQNFFSSKNNINIFEKIVNIDPGSFNKLSKIDNFKIPDENKNIKITYKKSDLQPTGIYAKFENFDTSKPFLVQLNRTFWMTWKLKWITKEDFDSKKCLDNYRNYSITDNSVCSFKEKFVDISSVKYLNYPQVPDKNHFEWNFVGNTWLVESENIPENMKNQKELYAIIIYEKQIWYSIMLIVSFSSFSVLLLLGIIQEIKNFRNKKYEQ